MFPNDRLSVGCVVQKQKRPASKGGQTSVFEVCGLSTMNQEKAADLHSRSALPAVGCLPWFRIVGPALGPARGRGKPRPYKRGRCDGV